MAKNVNQGLIDAAHIADRCGMSYGKWVASGQPWPMGEKDKPVKKSGHSKTKKPKKPK